MERKKKGGGYTSRYKNTQVSVRTTVLVSHSGLLHLDLVYDGGDCSGGTRKPVIGHQ